jgi:enoyl-CoA hydratase/carnithine racemase
MGEANTWFETRGPAAWITLGNSTIDETVVQILAGSVLRALEEPEVKVIVLAGPFAVDWSEALRSSPPVDPFAGLAHLPKPILAAISSVASDAGLGLALNADIRIASRSATFGPLTSSGGLPIGGAISRLTRLVGPAAAIQLVLVDEQIDANEALRIGLISEIADDVTARAQVIAERLAERGPLALQYAKEAVSRGIDMPLEQALRFETDLTVILQTTEDRAEGVRAFTEKRKPKFKGK